MDDGADTIGAAAAAALVAREIERAKAGAPALGHAADEPCANCGAQRHGPYCHACGQAGHVHRSLGAFVHDVAHGVFHFEGKFWSTLPLLALRPGELTRRYVHGERAKFVSPMALFLFSVFLMFAVVSNLAGHGGGKASDAADRAAAESRIAETKAKRADLAAARARAATPQARRAITSKIVPVDQALAALTTADGAHDATEGDEAGDRARRAFGDKDLHTGVPGLDQAVRHVARNPELALYKMKSYAYKYSWALIPISLPFLWLLFAFRRDTTLYDHAIFSIYSLSFMSLGVVALVIGGRAGVPTAIIALAAMIVPPLHMYRQLKGAYRLGRFGALWRTGALLVITAITSLLFAIFLFYLGSG